MGSVRILRGERPCARSARPATRRALRDLLLPNRSVDAAIDSNRLAGDGGCVWRGEEHDEVGYFARIYESV